MDGGSGWGRDGFGSGTGLDPDSIGSVDPDPGKSEGGDSREVRRVGGGGGGWAEDMEGRSGLTLLLHKPVLSLTLVYIIFFSWFAAASSCAAGRGRGATKNVHTQATAATGAIFSLSEKS